MRLAWSVEEAGGSSHWRLTDHQWLEMTRLAILLRWIAIALAGAAGLMAPNTPPVLVYQIIAAGLLNTAWLIAIGRLDVPKLRRLTPGVIAIDHVSCLLFIVIYSAVPNGAQVSFYFPAVAEAVAFYGGWGGGLSVAGFVIPSVILQMSGVILWKSPVVGNGLIGTSLIVCFMAFTLFMVDRILMNQGPATSQVPLMPDDRQPAVRLSRREHDVLRLVAEGYSNAMIASRLQVSDSTVKGYVESLLVHLNARNRAEAVAAASRLKLL